MAAAVSYIVPQEREVLESLTGLRRRDGTRLKSSQERDIPPWGPIIRLTERAIIGLRWCRVNFSGGESQHRIDPGRKKPAARGRRQGFLPKGRCVVESPLEA
jgi:hypothetical protein